IPSPAKVTLQADHPDHVLDHAVEVTIPELEPEVVRDFTLKHALAVSGTVTGETGQGEPNAVVRAWGLHVTAPVEAKAGPSGAYAFKRLEAGLYRIAASKPGSGLTSEFKDDVPARSTGIDFRLVKPGAIVG